MPGGPKPDARGSGKQQLDWLAIAVTAAEGAVLAALVDIFIRVVLRQYVTRGLHNADPYALWLSPIAHLLLLLPIVLGIVFAGRLLGREARILPWVRIGAYSYAALQGVLLFGRLHAAAAVVLCFGLGVAFARLTETPWIRRTLRTTTTSATIAALVFAIVLPILSLRNRSSGSQQASALPDSPNVLLLILDTVSARELSLYGYGRRTTPVLDSLARHGVVFDRAIASAPWTLPSHASIFTGRRASELSTRYQEPLRKRFRVVAEEFSAAGYNTAGFVANLEYTSRASGLARGFRRYEDYRPSLASAVFSNPFGRWARSGIERFVGHPIKAGRKDALEINREFLTWHREEGGRPWFAFLNYYDAHNPYVPPAGEERRFLSEGQEPVYDVVDLDAGDSAEVASARALHDAALFAVDRAIGELLGSLRDRGDLDNTLIVITADHGEEWGSQGVLLHGNSIYMPAIRVPLILVQPGRIPAGMRVSTPVGTRHLAKTMLHLVGLPADALGGYDLSPYWQGGTPPDETTAVVSWVEQAVRQPKELPASKSALYSVVTDSAQVIFGADTLVLDLATAETQLVNHLREPAFDDDVRLAASVLRNRLRTPPPGSQRARNQR